MLPATPISLHPACRGQRDRLKVRSRHRGGTTTAAARRTVTRPPRLPDCRAAALATASVCSTSACSGRRRGIAEENQSYGLATLLAPARDPAPHLDDLPVRAKSGNVGRVEVVDGQAADAVRALLRRRGGGAELLAYRDGRRWRDVTSADVKTTSRNGSERMSRLRTSNLARHRARGSGASPPRRPGDSGRPPTRRPQHGAHGR